AFHGLEIIALLQAFRNEDVARREIAPLDSGGRGLLALRSHIGPDHARALDAGGGLDPHVLAGLRGRRYRDAFPVDRALHALIGAADAVFLIATEVERRTAVRAEFIDQPDLAVAVAKGEQLLAEDLRAHRRTIRLGDLAREQDRHPVAAHQVAHRRAGAGAHERFGHLLVHRD